MTTRSIRRGAPLRAWLSLVLASTLASGAAWAAEQKKDGTGQASGQAGGANDANAGSGGATGGKGIDAGSGDAVKPPGKEKDIDVGSGTGGDTPLALDLDGDGTFRLAGDGRGVVSFDFRGMGTAVTSRWLAPGDGFLVLDLDGDGRITNGRELFGNGTRLKGGLARAVDGFEALAQHDANRDGRIDAQDPVFAKIMVWQDVNGDGIGTRDELKPLASYGIVALELNARVPSPAHVLDAQGDAWVGLAAHAVTKDGRRLLLGDIYFKPLSTTMTSR